MIKVLDKGYVRLVDQMGTDLSVVNAARVSFAKESEWDVADDGERYVKSLAAKDAKLLKYLAIHGHMSPFRHAMVTLEVKAPLFVARQWWKYVVGSDHTMDGWNEVSRRYVEDEPEFYEPNIGEWRSAPESKKQGSGGPIEDSLQRTYRGALHRHIQAAMEAYGGALRNGVCAEQARLFLPAYAMYTSWRWTASLESVAHFLKQRLGPDAQFEIREYAKVVTDVVTPLFPHSLDALSEAWLK